MIYSDDRILVMARDQIIELLVEAMAVGFDDLSELRLKLDGIDEAVKDLRVRADQLADERSEHPRECVPGPDMSWVR